MDAQRLQDGKVVVIKKTHTNRREGTIMQYLSSTDRSSPENHCVPVYEVFQDENIRNLEFIAMPLFRRFYDPPFENVYQVLDFVQQTLEVSILSEIQLTKSINIRLL